MTEPATAAPPSGVCVVCRGTYRLRKDGRIRHHGEDPRGRWYGGYRCPGAGLMPLVTP